MGARLSHHVDQLLDESEPYQRAVRSTFSHFSKVHTLRCRYNSTGSGSPAPAGASIRSSSANGSPVATPARGDSVVIRGSSISSSSSSGCGGGGGRRSSVDAGSGRRGSVVMVHSSGGGLVGSSGLGAVFEGHRGSTGVAVTVVGSCVGSGSDSGGAVASSSMSIPSSSNSPALFCTDSSSSSGNMAVDLRNSIVPDVLATGSGPAVALCGGALRRGSTGSGSAGDDDVGTGTAGTGGEGCGDEAGIGHSPTFSADLIQEETFAGVEQSQLLEASCALLKMLAGEMDIRASRVCLREPSRRDCEFVLFMDPDLAARPVLDADDFEAFCRALLKRVAVDRGRRLLLFVAAGVAVVQGAKSMLRKVPLVGCAATAMLSAVLPTSVMGPAVGVAAALYVEEHSPKRLV